MIGTRQRKKYHHIFILTVNSIVVGIIFLNKPICTWHLTVHKHLNILNLPFGSVYFDNMIFSSKVPLLVCQLGCYYLVSSLVQSQLYSSYNNESRSQAQIQNLYSPSPKCDEPSLSKYRIILMQYSWKHILISFFPSRTYE